MKLAAIFLLLACLISCSKSGPSSGTDVILTAAHTLGHSDEPEPWKSIRGKMESHHLRWNVFCDSGSGQESYLAYAYVEGEKMGLYVEDGAKPYWSPRKRYRTREEAGMALSKLVDGPPNAYPEHRPHTDKGKTHCLADIGTERHYSECKNCEETN